MAYVDLSTKKTRKRLSATLNESAADASHMQKDSFARKQLEKMGWTEGTGLGKNRDGRVSHIKAKKREDSAGLGVEKVIINEMNDVWWKDSVGSTLARLQEKKGEKKKKRKKDKDKKKSKKRKASDEKNVATAGKIFTDEELFAATGGARFGMRAQRRAEGKWARTESGSKLREDEAQAKSKAEWNGIGAAKVVMGNGSDGSKDGSEESEAASSCDADKVKASNGTNETNGIAKGTDDCDLEAGKRKREKKEKKKKTKKTKKSKI